MSLFQVTPHVLADNKVTATNKALFSSLEAEHGRPCEGHRDKEESDQEAELWLGSSARRRPQELGVTQKSSSVSGTPPARLKTNGRRWLKKSETAGLLSQWNFVLQTCASIVMNAEQWKTLEQTVQQPVES